jgi:ribose transport system ATP-binding protein
MKILSGAYTCDTGEVIVDGEHIKHSDPAIMIEKGVAVIYQEFMLIEHQTVAENIFLGRAPKTALGLINYKKMRSDTQAILKELCLDIDPDEKICDLSVARKQMVEIAKAMSRKAKIIVLDEPTAVLCEAELEGLFSIVRNLAEQGITFVYISHRLKEIFALCSHLTIMKDGKVVESGDVSNYDEDKLVKLMVGRDVRSIYPKRTPKIGEDVLNVKGLTRKGVLNNVTFNLRKGEILGIAGLAGAGRTEILRAIIGADKIDSGTVEIDGKVIKFRNPSDGIKAGIGIVPEERRTQGLMLKQNMTYNITIASLKKYMKGKFIINPVKERSDARKYVESLHIRPNIIDTIAKNMSGGNQQKVVLSKWLVRNCKILLVDEPTRGIDVGAKQEIYQILNDLVESGLSILMVSSELPELLGTCDRVIVMNEGTMTAMLDINEASEEIIMGYAATCDTPQIFNCDIN